MAGLDASEFVLLSLECQVTTGLMTGQLPLGKVGFFAVLAMKVF